MKTVKHFGSALFIIFILALYSCSHSDNSQPSNSDLLIGKWEFDKTITNGVTYDNSNSPCNRNFLEFRNNVSTEGHYNPNGCVLTLYPDRYTLENDIIKIYDSNNPNSFFEMKILEINNTSLKTSSYNGRDIDTYKRIN